MNLENEKLIQLLKVSDPRIVIDNLKKYLINNNIKDDIRLYISYKKNKKYMINVNGKSIHFGNIHYEDFTKHNNQKRRDNYLKRTANIKGNWKSNIFSPNNLSRYLLWNK